MFVYLVISGILWIKLLRYIIAVCVTVTPATPPQTCRR